MVAGWPCAIPSVTDEQGNIYSEMFMNFQHICCYCPQRPPSVKSPVSQTFFYFSNPHCTLICLVTDQVAFYNLSAPASAGVVRREDMFWAEGKNSLEMDLLFSFLFISQTLTTKSVTLEMELCMAPLRDGGTELKAMVSCLFIECGEVWAWPRTH